MNKKQTLSVLDNLGIKPSKKLGQNFLIDENVGRKILNEANISESEVILEIGPGLGALLKEIVKLVKKVYAYEIDFRLFNYLKNQFSSYDNLLLYNEDFLSIDQPNVDKVVSNIPYTITGPIFEKVFYINNPPEGILTIEKSIADRIFHPTKYKKTSRISITCNAFMEPVSLHNISPAAFYPEPRIKLSLIHIKPKKKIDPFLMNLKAKQFFLEFIQGIMPYKNKDLVNALDLYLKNKQDIQISKQELLQMLKDNRIKNDKFALMDIDYFIHLSKALLEFIKNLKKCE